MKKEETLFVVFDNQDYMGGSFMSAGFHTEEGLKSYLDHMLCWSGHISVVDKIPIQDLNGDFLKKYGFTSEEKERIIDYYRKITNDYSKLRWAINY